MSLLAYYALWIKGFWAGGERGKNLEHRAVIVRLFDVRNAVVMDQASAFKLSSKSRKEASDLETNCFNPVRPDAA